MRGKRVAADQVDVSLYKTQESYADKFEELDWNTLQKKLDWVTNVCGQQISYDEGRPGVNVRVHEDGRKRIRLG
ncbi:unnamed protein product, partial [Effrenium voratum]